MKNTKYLILNGNEYKFYEKQNNFGKRWCDNNNNNTKKIKIGHHKIFA